KEKYSERPNRYLMKHHYLSPKIIEKRINITENKKTLKEYLDDRLFVESWQSAMIVTTFVQFLHTVFGYKNRFLKKFHNIINSIVILDEVQNIDPNYHRLIQKAFKVLGNVFNTYFLQITATQPNMFDKTNLIEIVNSDYYMKNDVFNRVKLNINSKHQELEDFANKFCDSFSDDNCLLVMNTKKFATNLFYKIQKNLTDYQHFCLTTNLTPFHRNKKIKEIRKLLDLHKKVIVVSTQLIEAGVDLSFKNVYRDFGPIDSIIQVAGRCNRSGELGILGGNFNLINLSNSRIYSKALIQYSEEILKNEKYSSIDFIALSEKYFNQFTFSLKSKMIIRAIKEMNYNRKVNNQIPVSDFKLIPDDPRKNIYILHTEEADKQMRELIENKRKLKFVDNKKERNEIIIEIEKLKHKLIRFQISVYQQELNVYNDLLEPENELAIDKNFTYIFISYDNQKEYVYDENVGFLKEPKKNISSTIMI
ncbi:MAG: hypothetical protein U9N76_07130, partial [Candidatus Marinimicrobia bacterium]|nr:hypothetical protein [Candidatus Neomarinimicrobiota bacterium]